MTKTSLRGRHVTVLGFGRREGVSLVRFLANEGAHVLVSDRQPAERLRASLDAVAGLPVEYDLGGHDEARILHWSDLICVSPVIPRTTPLLQAAAQRGIALSSEVELVFERCPVPILGVTGSAGKTTTTTLVGEMLCAAGRTVQIGGNIGHPLLNSLDAITPETAVVMELSSFQLQPMTRSPHGAVVTNVTPNHLDRHADMAEYIAAKRQIVAHQRPDDWAVLNVADVITREMATATKARVAWFSGEGAPEGNGDAAYLAEDTLWLRTHGESRPLLPVQALRLPGSHNQENALAASLAAALAGAPDDAIRAVLTTFRGVEHRLQLVGTVGGARFYDDSIATAPERLLAAVRSFSEPLVLILGGRDKHLPWEEAASVLCRRAHHVVVTGEAAGLIRETLRQASERVGHGPMVVGEPQFDDAVRAAIGLAQPGDAVLLSPGCTSFDQFEDFAARGRRFTSLVQAAMQEREGKRP